MQEIRDRIQEVKDRQKLSWEGMFYSMQRIDLLIISISGAGIYVCLETIKYLTDASTCVSWQIKVSGATFLFAIILNFLSQLSGYKTNEKDYLMCQAEIEAGNKISKSEQEQIDSYDRLSERYTTATRRFNYLSMLFMFIGLTSIMYYFLFIF